MVTDYNRFKANAHVTIIEHDRRSVILIKMKFQGKYRPFFRAPVIDNDFQKRLGFVTSIVNRGCSL